MKRQIPIILCSLLGFCLVVRYFIPHRLSQDFESTVNDWVRILAVFAFVIGLGSLIRVHLRRIAMKVSHWQYSIVVFVGLLLMPLAALVDFVKTPNQLASLPANLTSKLQNGPLPATVRQALTEGGLSLPPVVTVESVGKRWKIQEQRQQFATDASSEIITQLDQGKIDRILRQKFSVRDLQLPESIEVTVQSKGRRWLLESGALWYLLTHQKQILTVSRDTTAAYIVGSNPVRSGDLPVYASRKFSKQGSSVNWLFLNVYVPLDATMFSLLAFFIASAAYRAFRARTMDATLLLLAGVILMFANAPLLANQFWHSVFGGLNFLPDAFPTLVKDWILQVPGMAARRAIQIGLALGAISQSLRILLGIDRAWMGE